MAMDDDVTPWCDAALARTLSPEKSETHLAAVAVVAELFTL